MGKKKKKSVRYRIGVAVLAVGVAALLTSCESLRLWAEQTPEPPPPGTGTPPAGPVMPTPNGGGVDVLDIVVWGLAAAGLLPAARLAGASRPLIAPLITLLLGPSKAKKAAEEAAKDGAHTPS